MIAINVIRCVDSLGSEPYSADQGVISVFESADVDSELVGRDINVLHARTHPR